MGEGRRAVIWQGELAGHFFFFATADSNLTIQGEQELIILKMTANIFIFVFVWKTRYT